MISLKLSLFLFLFAVFSAASNSTVKKVKSSFERKAFPFSSDDLTWNKPYYVPYQQNYPILAEITPINQENQKISASFKAYVFPSLVSNKFYPFYSVLCKKEPTLSSLDEGSQKNIEQLKQVYLNPLYEKLKQLNDRIKKLSKLVVNNVIAIESDRDEWQTPKVTLAPVQAVELTSTTAKQKETSKPAPFKPFMPKRPKEIQKPPFEKNSRPGEDKSPQNNVNIQSSVFQCGGINCPSFSISCKVVEHAVEPKYDEIVQSVFCMSEENEVLLKDELVIANRNRGSSHDSTKTFFKKKEGDIEDIGDGGFKEAMKNMEMNMIKTFGKNQIIN